MSMLNHDSAALNIENVAQFMQQQQSEITKKIAVIDGSASFKESQWQKSQRGYGDTRVLSQGMIFEQAGVNFSHIIGTQLPPSASVQRAQLAGAPFQATGLSIVVHPNNPYIPTVHANIRFFIAQPPNKAPVWWCGGGFDLTPYYGFVEDVIQWHKNAKNICDQFDNSWYPKYKKWCDDYFFIKHRAEARGVGGIFFDDLNQPDFSTCFQFIQAVAKGVLLAYLPIVEKRKNIIWGEREREFQLYRRGRYVEFNLIYDRGTLFGLQNGGRTESILISMPPLVSWRNNYQPPVGSKEAVLYQRFLPVQDWI